MHRFWAMRDCALTSLFAFIPQADGPRWRQRITLQRGDHQTPGQRDFIAIDNPLKKELEFSG